METIQAPIRLILVDDHQMLLELLADAIGLDPRFRITATCTGGSEAIETVRKCPCDVLLIDLIMPGVDGLECIRTLRRIKPELKTLVLSGNTDPVNLSRAMRLGVLGYVEKSAGLAEIMRAINTIGEGGTFFGGSIKPTVRRLSSSPFPLDAADRLTARERVVLAGIASGGTSKKIASQLGLSEFTVKSHRRRIKSKTGLQTNAELVLHAAKLGLCPQVSP